MIRGQVNVQREAIVRLKLRGTSGVEIDVDAMVDTGYSAALTLPASTIAALSLVPITDGTMILADGSARRFDIYAVQVLWDGSWRPVLASALGHETLIGMRLLAGHALYVEVKPAGSVVIDRLP